MGLFRGKDDVRYEAWRGGARRAEQDGDHDKADRQRAKADEVARDGDVSTASRWFGMGW